MRRSILPLIALICISSSTGVAAPLSPDSQLVYDSKVRPFLQANCFKCHGEAKTLAGLRIDLLESDFLSGKSADVWKEMYDRLGNGTMPPKKQPRPDATEASAVTDWIIRELANAEKQAKGSSGRIPTRRLNRTEYVNTLRDLFYLDENAARALEQELPADGKVDGFDRGGAGLFIDEAQMAKYLEIADGVLSREEVFGPGPAEKALPALLRPQRCAWVWAGPGDVDGFGNLSAGPSARGQHRRMRIPDGPNVAELKRGGLEYISAGKGQEGRLDTHGFYWAWGDKLQNGNFTDGWYRLKLRAGAFKGTGKYAVDEVNLSFVYGLNSPIESKGSVVIDAPLEQPRDFEIMVYLRVGSPGLPRSISLRWNGGKENVVVTNPEIEWNGHIWADLSNSHANLLRRKIPPSAAEIEASKKKLEIGVDVYHTSMLAVKSAWTYNPEIDLKAIPRIWIESVELQGPVGDWPPKGRTDLLFDGDTRPFDKTYIREIFARFLPRAYRRAVESQEIDDAVAWVLKDQEENHLSGNEAVIEGVKMVLCSPGFLMIQEPAGDSDKPRKLTDYELACRLSYFLWSTMPDAELFKLAADNQLHEPKTLSAQVRRMIADPKSGSLVTNFTGQWLKVREFSSVITDRVEYKSYDDALRDSSRREPFEFFREVLQSNLSILNFLDSDFVVIDNRLATHYGIEGVIGDRFRKVPVSPELHRGGVLGMAGILTFLSDGSRTLPVRRGSYVLETLWNSPPRPPPPNVGPLPAIGKVKTVRERLELHRKSDSCASCHAKIDPFGLALENYDAIGAWRTRMNGERFKGDMTSPPLDVSGVLPSGREFKTVEEFKQALLAEKERFIHGFVEKMLTYALGRPVGATDRPTINEIMKALEPPTPNGEGEYRLQALIQAIVASQPFQTK